jgi:hypothetical protein
MGASGTGLYSGDFAVDLRASIAAVSRMPLDYEALVDAVCEAERSAATNPADEDHTIFCSSWPTNSRNVAYPAGAYGRQPWTSSTAARTRR